MNCSFKYWEFFSELTGFMRWNEKGISKKFLFQSLFTEEYIYIYKTRQCKKTYFSISII